MDWISVEDEIPNHEEPIIYTRPDGKKWIVGVAYWTVSDRWNPDIYSDKDYDGFTHFMYLPRPPFPIRKELNERTSIHG